MHLSRRSCLSRRKSLRLMALLAVVSILSSLGPGLTAPVSALTGNVAIRPPGTALGLLHVFVPGTALAPSDSSEFLNASAALGYHTIGVSYPNAKSVGKYCDTKDACFGQVRREIVYGNTDKYDSHFFDSSKVDVPPDSSIVGRLTQELTALAAADASWAPFVPDGRIDWTKVMVSGHSQGAGHAAILGIDQSVKRVAMMAGPNDRLDNRIPPSWTAATPTTNESNWFALGHEKDPSLDIQLKSWDALAGPATTSTGPAPTGERRLITTLSAADFRFHESVVVDEWLNRAADGTPNLKPSWGSLLKGTLGGPGTTVATPTITPAGGNFAGPVQVSLATETTGATIRYTINGADPTGGTGTVYSAPFTVSADGTVRARAFKSGSADSALASASFTFGPPPAGPAFMGLSTASAVGSAVTVSTPAAGRPGDLMIAAVRQKKTTGAVTAPAGWTVIRDDVGSARSTLLSRRIAASEPPSHRFDVNLAGELEAHILAYAGIDATSPIAAHALGTNTGSATSGTAVAPSLTPTVAGSTYVAFFSAKSRGLSVSVPSLTERSDTSTSALLAGADQLLSGTAPSGERTATLSSSSDRVMAQAILLKPGGGTAPPPPGTVATPTFNPPGGTYTSAQSVSLATRTTDANIRYTTDGTDPTASTGTPYSAPIQISSNTTVKARAFKTGMTESAVATAVYTISTTPPAAGPRFETSATANTVAGTGISIDKPPAVASGNLLLAAIRQKKTTGAVTPPGGWTHIRTDGVDARSSLYFKVATASEPASYSFGVNVTADIEGHILRYSGVSTSGPVMTSGVGSNGDLASTSTVDAPTLTPSGSNGTYVAIWSSRYYQTTVTPPAGMVERTDTSGITTLATADQGISAGTVTGVRTATLSAPSDRRIGQAVLLRPA